MSQSLSQLYVHIVFHVNFVTNLTIPAGLQPRLHAYLAAVCNRNDSPSLCVGGTEDHIHILCRISRKIAPSKLLEEIKTRSSAWMKTQSTEFGKHLDKFSWQKGYGIFSVSSSQVESVLKYISNQHIHHQKISFKDEYISLLKKHGIDYNLEYLWS